MGDFCLQTGWKGHTGVNECGRTGACLACATWQIFPAAAACVCVRPGRPEPASMPVVDIVPENVSSFHINVACRMVPSAIL